MADLGGEQPGGDDAGDTPAVCHDGVGDQSHESHRPATVDELDVSLGKKSAKGDGRIGNRGVRARRRCTENTDTLE